MYMWVAESQVSLVEASPNKDYSIVGWIFEAFWGPHFRKLLYRGMNVYMHIALNTKPPIPNLNRHSTCIAQGEVLVFE